VHVNIYVCRAGILLPDLSFVFEIILEMSDSRAGILLPDMSLTLFLCSSVVVT
jgi:hypothetical protein